MPKERYEDALDIIEEDGRALYRYKLRIKELETFCRECCEYAERNGYVFDDGSITSFGKEHFSIYALYCRARELLSPAT